MNREQFIEFHKQLTDRALAISSKKNHDYCGTQVKDNPFANLQLANASTVLNPSVLPPCFGSLMARLTASSIAA